MFDQQPTYSALNAQRKKVTVMGLGLFGGGVGAARFWAQLGSAVTVTDLRDEKILAPSIAALQDLPIRYVLGRHEADDFTHTDLIMINPAVTPDNKFINLAMSANIPLQTEIGLAIRLCRGRILAVTGANGKSTTTALLGAMITAHDAQTLIGGNIGGSVLDELSTHLPSAPVVLELSSFQLYYLQDEIFTPHIAIVTNLTPNHLDWHQTVLHYYESKRRLLKQQTASDFAVLNYDQATLCEWAENAPATVIMTALNEPPTINAGFIREDKIYLRLGGEEKIIGDFSTFKLFGDHNKLNAVQAAVAAYLYHQNSAAIKNGMSNFAGLPHRLQQVATLNHKRFINDSIATTPESTICGLNAFSAPVVPIVLIAGGYDKGSDWTELAKTIISKAHSCVLIGKTASAIRDAILQQNPDFQIFMAGDNFTAAIEQAEKICPDGGIILLSPACASYDMFKNFSERGETFANAARLIALSR